MLMAASPLLPTCLPHSCLPRPRPQPPRSCPLTCPPPRRGRPGASGSGRGTGCPPGSPYCGTHILVTPALSCFLPGSVTWSTCAPRRASPSLESLDTPVDSLRLMRHTDLKNKNFSIMRIIQIHYVKCGKQTVIRKNKYLNLTLQITRNLSNFEGRC